jgi:hypothetical protein
LINAYIEGITSNNVRDSLNTECSYNDGASIPGMVVTGRDVAGTPFDVTADTNGQAFIRQKSKVRIMTDSFTGKDSIVLFFGILWGITLSIIGRYRLFDTHLFFCKNRRKYAISRFIIGFFVINIAPIIWFYLLYTYVASELAGAVPIMISAFSSLSLFGFNRVLHAVIAADNHYSRYYSKTEWEAVLSQWGRGSPNTPNTFVAHAIPGIAYLVVIPIIAKVISWIWILN